MKKERDWYSLNTQENSIYIIEWSSDGWLRVKYHNDTVFKYKRCAQPKHALPLGEKMLEIIDGGKNDTRK